MCGHHKKITSRSSHFEKVWPLRAFVYPNKTDITMLTSGVNLRWGYLLVCPMEEGGSIQKTCLKQSLFYTSYLKFITLVRTELVCFAQLITECWISNVSIQASHSLQQRQTGPHHPMVNSVNVSTVLATALLSLAVGHKKHCAIEPQCCLWGQSARQVYC